MHRVHPVSYPLARHDRNRPPKLHQRRDLCALHELELALLELGFRHGEPIFNQSPAERTSDEAFEIDLSRFAAGDLLLQCMRPPMNDLDEGPKRKIEPANTNLERFFFRAFEPCIAWSARSHLRLAPAMQARIRLEYQDRREMSFQQKGWGAPYHELNALEGHGWRRHKGPRRTALFLLHVAALWPGGPGYLCAFGMDGCTTCVWSYRLARDLRHLLARPGFVMAELELGQIPEDVTDLRFCLDWKIEPLLVHEFTSEIPPSQPQSTPTPPRAKRTPRKPALVPQG